jgi:LPS-assembly lipoprotein
MWSSERRRALAGVAALSALSALSIGGCGFALRPAPKLAFRSIALTGFAPRSPLAEELQRNLAGSVQVVDAAAKPEVVLQALTEQRDKGVVASTSAAQVREFQVRLKFGFRAHTAAGRELIRPVELLLVRDLSYTEEAALAKAYEEADLYREMQSDIVAQVLQRLAAIQL